MGVFLEAASPLTTLASIFDQLTTWMGSMANTIAGNTLMLLPIGIFITGASIGLIKRLLP